MTRDALNDDQRSGVTIEGKRSLTVREAAEQLTRDGPGWSNHFGTAAVVTYAFRASAPAVMPADSADFQRFSGEQIAGAERALKLWGEMANIAFVRVGSGTSGEGAYSNDATILFGDYRSGVDGAAAFAFLPGNTSSASNAGDVWINSTLSSNITISVANGYGFLTLLHEIGHSIGLNHPSDYDAGDDDLTYSHSAVYYEDSLEYSIMSYFGIADTGGAVPGVRAPGGPLIDDIAAVQRLYGANNATNAGNTIYGGSGFPANDPVVPDAYLASQTLPVWGTIWDGGGIDTIAFGNASASQKIDLRAGSFSNVQGGTGNLSIALGVTIENAMGGAGSDVLIGNDAANVLQGKGGADRMTGGLGANIYVGGADGPNGAGDLAVLNGNTADFTLLDGGSSGYLLQSRNGSGDQWIDRSTEVVQFRNGQYLSIGDLAAYVSSSRLGTTMQMATFGAVAHLQGGAGFDLLYAPANVDNYLISRTPASAGAAQEYVLTPRDTASVFNGAGVIYVKDSIEELHFFNGQYLSLGDLTSFITADRSFAATNGDDAVYQRGAGYELLYGAGGNDTAYLRGNPSDYVVRPFTGRSASGALTDTGTGLGSGAGGLTYTGLLLTSVNGSGALLIDHTIESVHFAAGEQYSYGTLAARIGGGGIGGELQFTTPGETGLLTFSGTRNTVEDVLLNGNVADFTVGRSSNGDIYLDTKTGSFTRYTLDQTIDTVHFLNGQYLSLHDFPSYFDNNFRFTIGTSRDDLLIVAGGLVPASGTDIFGGDGVDDFYVQVGNVADYTLYRYHSPAGAAQEIDGYKLVRGGFAFNIDRSVESVHFENGQYLAFGDLPAYVHDMGLFV